ncbi:MAG: hypothetical protein ACXAD7_10445 [Candidatus Kariarchaeaceae archaeon]|jgi:uncharacterized membrane protein
MNRKTSITEVLRLNSKNNRLSILIFILSGTLLLVLLDAFSLPEYRMGLFTIQIDLAILVIPLSAIFGGPLAGLFVGFFGTMISDTLYFDQIIAYGGINIAFGIFGFIVGIPNYFRENGFANSKNIRKLLLYTLLGFIALIMLYLFSLIIIAKQSLEGTLLYNFIPFFSVSLISLMLYTPILARLFEFLYYFTDTKLNPELT